MDKNVGGSDRTWRLVLGPLLVVVGLVALLGVVSLGPGWLAWVLLVVGLVFTVTGVVNFCPLNALFGRNTAR